MHLLAKDLLAEGGLLENLVVFGKKLQDIVTCFTRSSLLRAKLSELQVAAGARGLVKQAETRWCSMKQCAVSILQNEQFLFTLVSERDFTNKSADTRAARVAVRETIIGLFFLCVNLLFLSSTQICYNFAKVHRDIGAPRPSNCQIPK